VDRHRRVLVLIVGGIFWYNRGSGADASMTAGISAMKNGQLETARGEFAKAVKSDPSAATPHVFLARIARNQSDLATARAELDTARRVMRDVMRSRCGRWDWFSSPASSMISRAGSSFERCRPIHRTQRRWATSDAR
jgi:hypothetical protein